jgi:DNA polymerase-3 subunit delta'
MSPEDEASPALIIGHEWAVELIQRGLATQRLSQSYLMVGPPRVGKTTLALYLARAVNCVSTGHRPCGACGHCQKIAKGIHPDVRLIDEPASDIGIDQIRDIQREMSLAPFEGRHRVYVLCNFHLASLPAANCLLKTLEEPPPRVVLILTATHGEALLPTIVSRCQLLHLRSLPVAQVQASLESRWNVESGRANLIARLSEGRIGWAIEASNSDALLHVRDKYFVALEQVLRQAHWERIGLAQRLSQNPQALPELFNLWESWWRDIMLTKSGNPETLTNPDREQTFRDEARRLTWDDIKGCLHSIQHARQQIDQNVNPGLTLEVLLLRMPDLAQEPAS